MAFHHTKVLLDREGTTCSSGRFPKEGHTLATGTNSRISHWPGNRFSCICTRRIKGKPLTDIRINFLQRTDSFLNDLKHQNGICPTSLVRPVFIHDLSIIARLSSTSVEIVDDCCVTGRLSHPQMETSKPVLLLAGKKPKTRAARMCLVLTVLVTMRSSLTHTLLCDLPSFPTRIETNWWSAERQTSSAAPAALDALFSWHTLKQYPHAPNCAPKILSSFSARHARAPYV